MFYQGRKVKMAGARKRKRMVFVTATAEGLELPKAWIEILLRKSLAFDDFYAKPTSYVLMKASDHIVHLLKSDFEHLRLRFVKGILVCLKPRHRLGLNSDLM